MAEAHSAVSLLELDSRHAKELYDDDEFLTIRINKTLYKAFLRWLRVCLVNYVIESDP